MVSRVVAPDDVLPEAQKLAARIAANPPGALRMAKRLIREGQNVRFDTLLEMAAAFQAACHHTRDHEEAVSAFFEKRKPVFVGE